MGTAQHEKHGTARSKHEARSKRYRYKMKEAQVGERSASLVSLAPKRKKQCGDRINWLYVIAVNAVIIDLLFVWFILGKTGPTVNVSVPGQTKGGLVSRGGSKTKKTHIGFMILGANREDYPKSMDQRIEAAYQKFEAECNKPNYKAVFFPTGRNNKIHSITKEHIPEARYIKEQILKKFKSRDRTASEYLKKPIINEHTEEGRALFTVDNFLKTIPKISKYQRDNNMKFEKVYLVTNEYHMGRSTAILDEFEKQDLVDFDVIPCQVDKRICDENKDEKLTRMIDSGKWNFETNVREDTDRDIKNSASFARAIFMKVHRADFHYQRYSMTYHCDKLKYIKANCGGDEKLDDGSYKWGSDHEKMKVKGIQFDDLVNEYVELISHNHSGKCVDKVQAIVNDEPAILNLLWKLKKEVGTQQFKKGAVLSPILDM